MTEAEAYTIFDKEFPKYSGSLDGIMTKAKKNEMGQEEALKTLLSTPELLQPLLFMVFVYETNLQNCISHVEYAKIMRQKALKSKNQALLNVANAALCVSLEK